MSETISVQNCGAVGDGIADESDPFNEALAAIGSQGGSIDVPTGAFRLPAGFSVTKPHVTLRLEAGARLLLGDTLKLWRSGARLIGSRAVESQWSPDVDDPAAASLRWIGPANGIMLQVGGNPDTTLAGATTGLDVENVFLDGQGVSGLTGIQLGYTASGNPHDVRSLFMKRVGARRVKVGIAAGFGVQEVTILHPMFGSAVGAIEAGSVGMDFNAPTTAINVMSGTIRHWDTAVRIGSGGLGCAPDYLTLQGIAIYDYNIGVDAQTSSGGGLMFRDLYLEAQGVLAGKRHVRVGTPGGYVSSLTLDGLRFGDGDQAGLIEGFGWRGLKITGCTVNRGSVPALVFKNTGGGSARRGGSWFGNFITDGSDGVHVITEIDDLTGFDFAQLQMPTTAGSTPTLVMPKNLRPFFSNASAMAGGLPVGALYRLGTDPDVVCVVH